MTKNLCFTEECADVDHFRRHSKDLGNFSTLYPYHALTHFKNRRFKSMRPQMKLAPKTDHSYGSLELNE